MLNLLACFCIEEADLLDHLNHLALGLSQGISDLAMHYVDVGLAVLDVRFDRLAGGKFTGHLLKIELAKGPHVGNGVAGSDPVHPLSNQKGRKDNGRQFCRDPHPIGNRGWDFDLE